jgi:hypothetical protein
LFSARLMGCLSRGFMPPGPAWKKWAGFGHKYGAPHPSPPSAPCSAFDVGCSTFFAFPRFSKDNADSTGADAAAYAVAQTLPVALCQWYAGASISRCRRRRGHQFPLCRP